MLNNKERWVNHEIREEKFHIPKQQCNILLILQSHFPKFPEDFRKLSEC